MSRGQAISSKSLGMVEEHSPNGNRRVCATKQGYGFQGPYHDTAQGVEFHY